MAAQFVGVDTSTGRRVAVVEIDDYGNVCIFFLVYLSTYVMYRLYICIRANSFKSMTTAS